MKTPITHSRSPFPRLMGACNSKEAVDVENTSEQEIIDEQIADPTPDQPAPKDVNPISVQQKNGGERDRGMMMTEYSFQQVIKTTIRIDKARNDKALDKLAVVDLRGLQDRKARVTVTPVTEGEEVTVEVYSRGEDIRQFPVRARDCGGEVLASSKGTGAQSVEFSIPARGVLVYLTGNKGDYEFLAESLEDDFPIYMSHSSQIGVGPAPQEAEKSD